MRSRPSSVRASRRPWIATGDAVVWVDSCQAAVADPQGVPDSGRPQPEGAAGVDDVLARAGLFQGVAPEAADALATSLTYADYTRGDTVFAEGEQGDSPYIVLSGKVKVGRKAADGRENMLSVMGPSEMFGDLSLFDPGPRTATATVVTDARLACLAHNSLRPWITDRPEIAEQLLRVLARRLRRTNDALADLIFTDVPGRVAKALLGLAERFGTEEPDGVRVHHDLTQEELAQLVGASRETVNKALADFASRGWMRVDSRAVTILDRDRLARPARWPGASCGTPSPVPPASSAVRSPVSCAAPGMTWWPWCG